jgi:hypothetical protein
LGTTRLKVIEPYGSGQTTEDVIARISDLIKGTQLKPGDRGRSTVSTIDGLNASEPSGSNKLSMTINQDAVAEVKAFFVN